MPGMTITSEILLARLAEGLDSTAKMTHALLSDLRESEADFAAMKTELNILKENVRGLSEVIRDGGTSSIMTRVALIEQNIDNIKKWMDNHVDVHQRFRKEINEFKSSISDIEKRLVGVELILKELEDEAKSQVRARQDSINREMDFVHEKKKNDDKIRAERQSAIVKIVAAIVIGVFGLGSGYFAKSCSVKTYEETPQSISSAR